MSPADVPMGAPSPMSGAAPSPDEMMALQQADAGARREAIAVSAPKPTKPYSVAAIRGLIEQFNETLDALGGQDLPDVTWAPPAETSKWDAPLPAEIYAPLVALKSALATVAGGEYAKKYPLDCESMTDDTQVRRVTGLLGKMAKDKAMIKELQAPAAPPAPESAAPRTPAPSEMDETDRALMAGM